MADRPNGIATAINAGVDAAENFGGERRVLGDHPGDFGDIDMVLLSQLEHLHRNRRQRRQRRTRPDFLDEFFLHEWRSRSLAVIIGNLLRLSVWWEGDFL